MRTDYNIGADDNTINLGVSIGTPGIAHTIVFQFKSEIDFKKLLEADANSGSIPPTLIGNGEELINSFIKIRTSIDFGSIDSSQWEQLGKTIVGNYYLSGGIEGEKVFNYDADDITISDDGRIVIIDKEVNLS